MNVKRDTVPGVADRGPLLLVMASVFWGTTGIAAKFVYQAGSITPLTLGFFRLAVAGVFLLVAGIFFYREKEQFRSLTAAWGQVLGFGAALAVFQFMYFQALRETTATAAAILLTLTPFWVAVGSALLYREYPSCWVAGWGVAALAGVGLLMGVTQPGTLSGTGFRGNLWALGASVAYAAYYFFSRSLLKKHKPLPVMAAAFTLGALFLGPLVLSVGVVPRLPVQGWAWTTFLGVVSTGLAGLLYLGGLRTTNTTVASLCGLMEPLTASLLGWGLLGERLSPISWAGAGVLLMALAFISAEGLFRPGKNA